MTQTASAYARVEGDKYFTPAWVTAALLSVERFSGPILDPGAGAGHIVDVLKAAGLNGYGQDISPDRDDIFAMDFFDLSAAAACQNIITNPPYGKGGRLAVDFIRQALSLTAGSREPGKVAMLLRVDFDSANGRREIFNDHPAFAAKYTLTKRIRWANLQQSAAGPTENHAWFVWDWAKRRDAARAYGYLPLPEKAHA
jgi:hypothetical protein